MKPNEKPCGNFLALFQQKTGGVELPGRPVPCNGSAAADWAKAPAADPMEEAMRGLRGRRLAVLDALLRAGQLTPRGRVASGLRPEERPGLDDALAWLESRGFARRERDDRWTAQTREEQRRHLTLCPPPCDRAGPGIHSEGNGEDCRETPAPGGGLVLQARPAVHTSGLLDLEFDL